MHAVMVFYWCWLAVSFYLAWPAWVGIAVVAALLAYEHSLLKPNDLSKMNAAFFTVNGYISLLFLLFWGAAALRCSSSLFEAWATLHFTVIFPVGMLST